MPLKPYCVFQIGRSPIVAAAIHDGHDALPEVERHFALDEVQRLHEEDPYTAEWTQIAKTQIIGLRTRFEVDLNRPRDKAIYKTPEDAWGLKVWKSLPDPDIIEARYKEYDDFYQMVHVLLAGMLGEYRRVLVYDLHTYNHRREGAGAPPADWRWNPEINVGTGTMDRAYWAPVVDRFISDLKSFDFDGRQLDVRENVRFQGGNFPRWIHETFPDRVCAIAIEVKKFFMDEWTQETSLEEIERIYKALQSTLPGVEEELNRL
jgi:N-formylglutamate deformylase